MKIKTSTVPTSAVDRHGRAASEHRNTASEPICAGVAISWDGCFFAQFALYLAD